MLKQHILFLAKQFLFWTLFFLIARVYFLFANFDISSNYAIGDWVKMFLYGIRMDISMAGYLSIIPGFILVLGAFVKNKMIQKTIRIYNIIFITLLSLMIIGDAELYSYWGFRTDISPFVYLKNPKEAMASLTFLRIAWLTTLYIVFILLFFFLNKKILSGLNPKNRGSWYNIPVFLFLTAALIIPIRGGFGVSVMNISKVYFHKKSFPNHAAVNVVWNFGYSITKMDSNNERPHYFTDKNAKKIFDATKNQTAPTQYLLTTKRPNILIIMLESFTAQIIEELGEYKNITPGFSKLIKEGVLFSNIYAAGDRSDEGMGAIISGYPSLPKTSVVNFPRKSESLNFLSRDLNKIGYQTAFMYGSDLDFANMASYCINGGFDSIFSVKDFPAHLATSKWGVHDEYLFPRLLQLNNNATEPFFHVAFTLSSHEPFDVPMETEIEGDDRKSKFFNALRYTDKHLANFIKDAKQQPWWDNTLVVLVSDHGKKIEPNNAHYDLINYHIPMLWLGGALNVHDTIIPQTANQYDIPATILGQMNIDNSHYKFSRDIFNSTYQPQALYIFNNGFCAVKKQNFAIYGQNINNWIKESKQNENSTLKKQGKVWFQEIIKDFVKR